LDLLPVHLPYGADGEFIVTLTSVRNSDQRLCLTLPEVKFEPPYDTYLATFVLIRVFSACAHLRPRSAPDATTNGSPCTIPEFYIILLVYYNLLEEQCWGHHREIRHSVPTRAHFLSEFQSNCLRTLQLQRSKCYFWRLVDMISSDLHVFGFISSERSLVYSVTMFHDLRQPRLARYDSPQTLISRSRVIGFQDKYTVHQVKFFDLRLTWPLSGLQPIFKLISLNGLNQYPG